MVLAWLALVFVLGVFLGPAVLVPGQLLAVVLVASLVPLWIGRRTWLRFFALATIALILGIVRSPPATAPTIHDLSFYRGLSIQVSGTVSQDPDIRDTGTNYIISVQTLTRRGHVSSVGGQAEVHTSRATALEFGDRVTLTGRLLDAGGRAGPQTVFADHSLDGRMQYPRLRVDAAGQSGWLGRLHALRRAIENGINTWLPEPEATLLIAITLGTRSAALGDLAPVLVATGLIHLIAISGIKVALVAGTAFQLVRNLGRRWLSLCAPLLVLWLYVLVTGFTPSGVRSAAMWTLVYLAAFLGRGTVALVSLSVVAALMVGLDPGLLWTIGFQLSVIGTFAIVALTDPVMRLTWPIPSPFREAFAVSLVAQLGTLPISIIGFHVLSPSGPVANAVVLPFLPLLIALGFVVGTVANIGWLAAPIAGFAYALLHVTVLAARALAGAAAPVNIPVFAPVLIVLYYALFLVPAWWVLRRSHWAPKMTWNSRVAEYALSAGIGLTLLTVWAVQPARRSGAQLDWLASGRSLLLQSGGHTALIDASPHPFVLLERLGEMLPFTNHHIDVLAVTDPRAANVGAFAAVTSHYNIGEVLDVGAEYPSSTYSAWRADLRQRRMPVYALRTGVTLRMGSATLTVLGPDGLYTSPADSAGIIRVDLDSKVVVITGSASIREQHEAIFRGVPLKADILIAAGALDADFVRAVRPSQTYSAVPVPGSRLLGTGMIRIVG